MILNCIIIDDEKPAIRQMEEYVGRVPFLNNLQSFNNAIEPLNFLKSNSVDLIFLDIEMENFTGLQFIKTLTHKPAIILTTAYDEYALDAFDLNVCDYLLKPISFERFLKAVEKVFDSVNPKSDTKEDSGYNYKRDYAFFKTEYRLQRVDFKDILFAEGMKEYIRIHTLKEKIMTLMNFKDLEDILADNEFCRVHKSYIVAVNKIDSIERQRIKIGDKEIPISETYKEGFFSLLKNKS